MSPDDFKKLIDEIDFSNPEFVEELKRIADGLGVEVEGLGKELDELVVGVRTDIIDGINSTNKP